MPSSATPQTIPSPEPGRARDDPVRAVGTDEIRRADALAADARDDPVVAELELGDGRARAEVRSRSRGLLREMRVEPPALRHLDERALRPLRTLVAVPGPEHESVHDVLDDGRDVARRMAQRASGHPAAARLVARERGLVREQHAHAGPRQVNRRGRPRRPGARDEDVEPLHARDRRQARGYNARPRRDSRVAKGGGL